MFVVMLLVLLTDENKFTNVCVVAKTNGSSMMRMNCSGYRWRKPTSQKGEVDYKKSIECWVITRYVDLTRLKLIFWDLYLYTKRCVHTYTCTDANFQVVTTLQVHWLSVDIFCHAVNICCREVLINTFLSTGLQSYHRSVYSDIFRLRTALTRLQILRSLTLQFHRLNYQGAAEEIITIVATRIFYCAVTAKSFSYVSAAYKFTVSN